jgi:hypothetical protein
MEPALFRLSAWECSFRARSDDPLFPSGQLIPADFSGTLRFYLTEGAKKWEDLIVTSMGICLFSERVARGFTEDKISGLAFCRAEVSVLNNSKLLRSRQPSYFWGRAEGIVEIDQDAYAEDRTIPISVKPRKGVDVFHLRKKDGLAGYAISRRAVESLRKHNVGNLEITPLDYTWKFAPSKPPYRIDLKAKSWPPASWYPEGFVPHPNNDINYLLGQ